MVAAPFPHWIAMYVTMISQYPAPKLYLACKRCDLSAQFDREALIEGRREETGRTMVRPGLTGRVKYLRGEGGLRHASLKGFEETTD